MLSRCYNPSTQKSQPTYIGCTVCDEWLTFSNFRRWMSSQEWEGLHLDKDLLVRGNKEYSPETCVFIHKKVNLFTNTREAARGRYLIGCHLNKRSGNLRGQIKNPLTGKCEMLGHYDTELEAHLAWKKRKHELSCELADSKYVTDLRLAEALRNRYKEIIDE